MNFSFLEPSIGKIVQIERGGPHKIAGKLRAISSDFLTIEKENGEIMYVHSQHIKTITESVLTEVQMTNEETNTLNTEEAVEPVVPIMEAATFKELLDQLTLAHRLVRLNQGGEAVEGVIIENRDDSVTLLHNMKDFVHFPLFHLKNLVILYQKNEEGKQKSDKQDEGKQKSDKSEEGKKEAKK